MAHGILHPPQCPTWPFFFSHPTNNEWIHVRAWWRVSKWHYSSKQIVTPVKWKEYASLIHTKWTGKRWRMSIDTVLNLLLLPEDSADCRASTWQEKQWSWWSISSKDLLFALLSPTIIVPHFGWSILAKLWERLPSQNQSFPHYLIIMGDHRMSCN